MGLGADLLEACNEQNRSSIARVFLASSCGITSFTAGSLQDFTAVTMDNTTEVFFQYDGEFERKDYAGEGANESGTATFTNVLNIAFLGLDKTKLKRLQEVIDERKITAIFETANSTGSFKRAFVVGWDNILFNDAAAKPNVNTVIEGPIDGDNSATLVLTAKHAELVREFVGTIITNTGTEQFGT